MRPSLKGEARNCNGSLFKLIKSPNKLSANILFSRKRPCQFRGTRAKSIHRRAPSSRESPRLTPRYGEPRTWTGSVLVLQPRLSLPAGIYVPLDAVRARNTAVSVRGQQFNVIYRAYAPEGGHGMNGTKREDQQQGMVFSFPQAFYKLRPAIWCPEKGSAKAGRTSKILPRPCSW